MDTATPAQLKRIAELEDRYDKAREAEDLATDKARDAIAKSVHAYYALSDYLRSVYPG